MGATSTGNSEWPPSSTPFTGAPDKTESFQMAEKQELNALSNPAHLAAALLE